MSVKHLCLLAVAVIIACGPKASGPPTSTVARRANTLVAAEIVAAKADIGTAYDALTRLRPNWLTAHGVSSLNPRANEFATVFVEGQLYGGLETLRNIQAYQVASLRYYDVTQAGAQFGLRAGSGGAIEVKLK